MALTAKKVYAILKRQISDMEAKLNSPVRYRGTVATADLLPLNPDIGDMYNIESKSIYGEAGMNVAWNGVVWDTMGAPIDMSLYIKSSELADWVKQQNKPTYTAEEVGALPADTKIPSKTSDLQNDSGFLTKIPDNYLSGTDKTLSVSGKAADAKTVGDKNVELLANILSKLDKNQGSENFGKIAGINESGDIVPMFPVSVDYNEETNCLEFGSDQKMELNKGINLDSTLTKTGYAADAGAVGEITNSLKEDLDNIKKKKNVVIYVGSAELSDEQKLSCDYICDGVDDQIEINQAIDSLPDSGGEIHLSRGIFNISGSITIRKRIKIVGEGKGITLDRNNVNNGGTTLLSELTGGAIIAIEKSDTLSDIKGITLSDFQILGAGISVENNYCNGINVMTYTDCFTLERIAICHCFYGLFVGKSATVDDLSVTNCDFQRDTCGIYIDGQGWQTRIENNIFWDMSGRHPTSGIVLSAGKSIVNGNYFGVSSLVFQGRTNAWIFAHNAVSLLCNGNSFSRCTSSPIRFEAGGQFASISSNCFSEIGKAQFQSNERAVLYVDGAGTGGGRISFTNNTVFWANGDDWKTSYLAYLTNQVAQVNISNNTMVDGIGKTTEDELVYKSEDSAYAITIGNNVLC